jgi:hypothetical protein
MTDETRILRTVGIPIVIGIVLLVVMPKMCVKAVVVAKAHQEKAARESGLHIESTHKPATYPVGLDAERVRYLIEIDERFSAPYTVHVAKSVTTEADAAIVAAMQKGGYIEQAPDGTRTLTRDGLLHLDGLVDEGTSWAFPIATRRFDAVVAIEGDPSNLHVTFSWRWQPNSVGAALLSDPKRHEAKADLSPSTTGWTMTGLAVDSDWR